VVRLLLAHPDVEANRSWTDGRSALCVASQSGHGAVVSLLVAHSAHGQVRLLAAGAIDWLLADLFKELPGVAAQAAALRLKVDVSIPGITAPSVFQSDDCVPCSGREISTNPQDKANLAACGITNLLFGDIVKGSVIVGNTIAKGTVNLGYQIRDGSIKVGNQVVAGAVNLGKTIETGTVDLGSKIARGSVDLGNKIGNSLKNLFGRR
jgi:hypothetical protein